jgi:hypothetical protein
MLISSYFSLKFGILHSYDTFKIIQIFIYLLSLQVFISNAIYEDKRSLKLPSTPSRSIFGSSLPPPTPQYSPNHAQKHGYEPLPSCEGCGLNYQCLQQVPNGESKSPAPPLSIGMWTARCCSIEILGKEKHEGVGGPCGASRK